MTSNTKLDFVRKEQRRSWKAALPRGSMMALCSDGTTVLLVPDGEVNRLYTSVCSEHERKIRRKVGEYYALRRYMDGDGTVIPKYLRFFQDVCVLFGGCVFKEE